MELTLSNVEKIEFEEINETDSNAWRDIIIYTDRGRVIISLFAKNKDGDLLKLHS